jgi:hypothetical protein
VSPYASLLSALFARLSSLDVILSFAFVVVHVSVRVLISLLVRPCCATGVSEINASCSSSAALITIPTIFVIRHCCLLLCSIPDVVLYYFSYPMLCNIASEPEMGLPGRILHGRASKSVHRPAEGRPEGRF